MTDDPSLLAAGYALGTLSAQEEAIFESYLASSVRARAEVAAYESTAAELGLDAPPIEPPPTLKADLMARIAVTPQLDLPADAVDVDSPGVRSAPPTAVPGPAMSRARKRWFTRPVGIVVTVAAAAALFISGTLVGTGIGNGQSFEQAQAAGLAQINSASDVRRASAKVASGGTATLIWSHELGKSAILINDLSTLPSDKTYELWYITGGAATPAGTVSASKNATTWRVLTGKFTTGVTVGVTVEPKGGSKAPTTKPIVAIPS